MMCEWCGKEFIAKRKMSKGKPRRFCGRSCSAKWRMSQPEYKRKYTEEDRKEASRKFNELRMRPDFQENLQAYYNSDRNPFKDPEQAPAIRAKAHVALRAKGYAMLNGGNGQPLPVPQQMLAAALGWPTEYVVPTGKRQAGRPTSYKIDIAEPTLKIAVEVDGVGHIAKDRQMQDRSKTEYLQEHGWTVIRVQNKEVLTDLRAVLQRILSTT